MKKGTGMEKVFQIGEKLESGNTYIADRKTKENIGR